MLESYCLNRLNRSAGWFGAKYLNHRNYSFWRYCLVRKKHWTFNQIFRLNRQALRAAEDADITLQLLSNTLEAQLEAFSLKKAQYVVPHIWERTKSYWDTEMLQSVEHCQTGELEQKGTFNRRRF